MACAVWEPGFVPGPGGLACPRRASQLSTKRRDSSAISTSSKPKACPVLLTHTTLAAAFIQLSMPGSLKITFSFWSVVSRLIPLKAGPTLQTLPGKSAFSAPRLTNTSVSLRGFAERGRTLDSAGISPAGKGEPRFCLANSKARRYVCFEDMDFAPTGSGGYNYD